MKDNQVVIWQRLEGAVFLAGALWWFHLNSGSWWLFLVFLFTPDIFCFGYLKNTKTGAFFYNLSHSLLIPGVILLLSHPGYKHHVFNAALIAVAHIGMDRMLGYGLKYDDSFKHTHLGWIGRKK